MQQAVHEKIESVLDDSVHGAVPLSGGCVGEVYRVSTRRHGELVAKVDASASPILDIEAYMLQYLADHSDLPVPRVLHASPDLLLMEFVEGNSGLDARVQEHAAELLAGLHGITADQFGLERDTLIGGLPQSNPFSADWVDFFAGRRLMHMGRQAVAAGRMGENTLGRIEKLCERLDDLLEPPAQPALLHGDIWGGNVIAERGQVRAFIDPAIYYGHPEIELAFITLFNTFGGRFFDAYRERRPISDGFFEVRKDIYNLFPLLVHVTLFGGSYLASVENTLNRF